MGVAGGEIAKWRCAVRIFLDREAQFRHSLIEAPTEQMRRAYYRERWTDTCAGAEAQRGLDVLDRKIGLARP